MPAGSLLSPARRPAAGPPRPAPRRLAPPLERSYRLLFWWLHGQRRPGPGAGLPPHPARPRISWLPAPPGTDLASLLALARYAHAQGLDPGPLDWTVAAAPQLMLTRLAQLAGLE